MDNKKISVGISRNLKDNKIINSVFKNLFKIKFKGYEYEILDAAPPFENKRTENDILILSESETIEINKKENLIIFFEDNLKVNLINSFGSDFPIPEGLFPFVKFKEGEEEYSEIARFEKVLKNLIRKILYREEKEEIFFKSIDWKISLEDSAGKEESTSVTLLSDLSMRDLMQNIYKIAEKIKNSEIAFEKYRKNHNPGIKKMEELEGTVDESKIRSYNRHFAEEIITTGIKHFFQKIRINSY